MNVEPPEPGAVRKRRFDGHRASRAQHRSSSLVLSVRPETHSKGEGVKDLSFHIRPRNL